MTAKAPSGWEKIRQENNGERAFFVWRNKDGEEIALLANQTPTKNVLDLLAANGVVPEVPSEFVERENETHSSLPAELETELPQTALDRALATLRQNRDPNDRAEVRVWKITEGKPPGYCARYTPEEWEESELDLIRKQFGGGNYRVEIWGTTARADENGPIKHGGKFIKLAAQTVEVVMPTGVIASDGKMSVDATGNLAPIFREFQTGMQRMQEQVMELARGQQRDPFAELEKLARLRDLFAPAVVAPAASGGLGKLMAEFEQFDALRARMNGGKDGGEGDTSMMGMLSKVMEMLPALAAQRNGQMAGANQQALPAPENTDALQDQQPEVVGTDVNGFKDVAMRATVKALCAAAARGEPVDAHAKGLLGVLDDEIVGVLEMPTWFDILSELQPDIAAQMKTQMAWFNALRDKMIELLDADDAAG